MKCCLFIVVVIVLLTSACAAKRVTRIISGELVRGRSTGYDAVRYFAAIGTLHGQATFDLTIFEIRRPFGQLLCGGALITPGIVQTACHCLSYKDQPHPVRMLPARVKHGWEYFIRVYIGVNMQFGGTRSMAGVAPLITKKFMVHQSCSTLPENTIGFVTHDYGWVILETDWDPKVNYVGRVNYAPLYTEQELLDAWDFFEYRQAVCLVLGFGPVVEGQLPANRKLRHGWLLLISRWKCVYKTTFGLTQQGVMDVVTWICMAAFPKHFQSPAPGDSGSPVSCNNQYFAIISSGVPVKKRGEDEEIKKFISINDAIYFAKFQNTREAREHFIRYMEAYGNLVESPRKFEGDTSRQKLHSEMKHMLSPLASSKNSDIFSSSFSFVLIIGKIIKSLILY